MQTHLILDAAMGAILIMLPWFLDFNQITWLTFVVLGIFSIIASIITKSTLKK